MTQHDLELIAKARTYPISDWDKIDDLADQAETPEARQRIRQIAIEYYHRDEASCGMI